MFHVVSVTPNCDGSLNETRNIWLLSNPYLTCNEDEMNIISRHH